MFVLYGQEFVFSNMHGIQQIFRQHGIDKKASSDSLRSPSSVNASYSSGHVQPNFQDIFGNDRNNSLDSERESASSWSQGKLVIYTLLHKLIKPNLEKYNFLFTVLYKQY